MTHLQGLTTFLNQWKAHLKSLIQLLVLLCKVQGRHNVETLAMVYTVVLSTTSPPLLPNVIVTTMPTTTTF